METKVCSKCGLLRDIDYFNKDKRAKDGLRSQCKICERIYRKPYELNRDKNKKREYSKKYRDTHKETEKARYQNWKNNNPDKYKSYHTLSKTKRRLIVDDIESDKDITLEKLYERDNGICKLCGGKCDYNDYSIIDNAFIVGNSYPSIDHILPLSKGGSHTWDNIQLVHKSCNSIKGNKLK